MAEDPTQSDNPEGEDRPAWLPENFSTGEDLANSYREAQRKITEEATARRSLENVVADLQAQQQATLEQFQQSQQPAEDPNEWYTAFEQDPIATQRALAEQAAAAAVQAYAAQQTKQSQPIQESQAEIVASLAYQQLEQARGPISEELRNEMHSIAQEYPHLIPQDVQSPQRLAASLNLLAELAEKKLGPQDPGPTQADLMRTMKVNAQSATGAGGRPQPADDHATRWQEIVNATTGSLGL